MVTFRVPFENTITALECKILDITGPCIFSQDIRCLKDGSVVFKGWRTKKGYWVAIASGNDIEIEYFDTQKERDQVYAGL